MNFVRENPRDKNKHSNMLRDTGDWLLIDPTLELKNEAQPAQFVAGRRRFFCLPCLRVAPR